MADNNGTPMPAGAPYNRGEQLKMWLGGEAELPPGAPYNRDEQLVMWLGDEAELPPGAPYNRDEQLTMWLKDHIGGGGNPNYVETIEGTLKNPWGNITASDLAAAFASNEVSVFLQITVNSKTVIVNPVKNGNYLLFSVAAYDPDDADSPDWSVIASAMYLTSTGKLVYAYYQQRGTLVDLEQMADNVTTVLTIIHHPLPDTP